MSRRFAFLLALVALLAVACTNAAPALTDPKEILTKSLESLVGIKTTHLDIDIAGKVKADVMGTGTASEFDLAGTKVTLDVDTTKPSARITGVLPSLLNTSGEFVFLPEAMFLKLGGPLAGGSDKWTKFPVPSEVPSDMASGSPTASQIAEGIAKLREGLDKLPRPPTKGADEKCGDADCYKVTINLTGPELAALIPEEQAGEVPAGDVTLDVFSRKSDLRPVRFLITLASPEMGTLTLTINATYDGGVSIAAPPPDQVTEDTGNLPFPIPSFQP